MGASATIIREIDAAAVKPIASLPRNGVEDCYALHRNIILLRCGSIPCYVHVQFTFNIVQGGYDTK